MASPPRERARFGGKFPTGWPEVGEFEGRPIRLADVEGTLSPLDWGTVAVRVRPDLVVRPWRGKPFFDEL